MSHSTSFHTSITTTTSPSSTGGLNITLTTTTPAGQNPYITSVNTFITEGRNINSGLIPEGLPSLAQFNTTSMAHEVPPPSYTHTENHWSGSKMETSEAYEKVGIAEAETDTGSCDGLVKMQEKGRVEAGLRPRGVTVGRKKVWKLKMWWQAYGRYKTLKKEIKEAEREVEIWRARYDGGFV